MGRGCAAFSPASWTQRYGLPFIWKRAGFGGLPFGAILWSRALPPLPAQPQAAPSILSWVRAHLGHGRAQKALRDVKGFVPLGWCRLQGCSVHEQSPRTNAAGEIRGSQVRHGAGGAALAPPLRLQGCLCTELCQLAVEPTAASPPRWETTAEGPGIGIQVPIRYPSALGPGCTWSILRAHTTIPRGCHQLEPTEGLRPIAIHSSTNSCVCSEPGGRGPTNPTGTSQSTACQSPRLASREASSSQAVCY